MLRELRLPVVATVLLFLSIVKNELSQVKAAYPPNLLNQTGCLYAYMSEGGKYEATIPDHTDPLVGPLQKFTYDSKCACIEKGKPGALIINFDVNDNNFVSMILDMQLNYVEKEYNWEISKATLTIKPVSQQLFPAYTLELRSVTGDIYAGHKQSYSCSSLVLASKTGSPFKITLGRFQVQPFHEPDNTVFATSRDCSTWLTLPQIMGFILMLFIIGTVLIGVYLLLELGSHSSDLRFSKQGGMLMNQAQLDATKAD